METASIVFVAKNTQRSGKNKVRETLLGRAGVSAEGLDILLVGMRFARYI